MFYIYNNVQMEMVKTNMVSFDAIYSEDGIDYLYSSYHIDIIAVLNPATMALRHRGWRRHGHTRRHCR